MYVRRNLHFGRIAMNIEHLADTLLQLVEQASQIAISTHRESDGDGMVAAFALQYYLKCIGRKSTIISDGEDLGRYFFLKEDREVIPYSPDCSFDLVIVVDCNSYDRLGARVDLVRNAKQVVVIDHHVIEHNPIQAQLSFIDSTYASVGAVLYAAFAQKLPALSSAQQRYFAECVYVTLLNDTNGFVNANTDEKVFELAASLVRHGTQVNHLYMDFMQNHTAGEMKYIGATLATIELVEDQQILLMHSAYALKQQCEVDPETFKQATRYVQGVKGLKAIVYFREDQPGEWKLSFRSLEIDVQKIASKYGGGGHRQASGCQISGSLTEIKKMLTEDLKKAIAGL